MANLNRIILVGRLTQDPDLRYTVERVPFVRFSLAVDRWQKKATDFINIVAWRKLAEICGQYLRKGRLVLVEGRIQVRSYDDKEGKKRWVTEVQAQEMKILDKSTQPNVSESMKPDQPQEIEISEDVESQTKEEVLVEDDIPF